MMAKPGINWVILWEGGVEFLIDHLLYFINTMSSGESVWLAVIHKPTYIIIPLNDLAWKVVDGECNQTHE
jgi:hypothetical protein